MRMLSQLQFSINGVFDIYQTQGKRLYGFSILFSILSSLWSIVLGAVVVFLYFKIAYTFNLSPYTPMKRFDQDGIYFVFNAVSFITILNISLYALALHLFRQNSTHSISLNAFFKSVSPSIWLYYFLFSIGGVIFVNIANDWLNSAQLIYSPNNSTSDLLSYGSETSFTQLFFSFIEKILAFTPVALGFLLLKSHFKKDGFLLLAKDSLITLGCLIILSLIIFLSATAFIGFINEFFIRILYMPFEEPLIPSILAVVIQIFLLGVFYLGFGSSYLFPFLYFNNKTERKNEMLLAENTLIDE